MGGSALPANLLKTYISTAKLDFHVSIKINRDYALPKAVDQTWCGFFNSYSGNTEETLFALKEAEKRGLKNIVILAHTGELKKIAEKKKYSFIQIPDAKQPRMAYGFYVGALLKVLKNSGLIKFDEKNFAKDILKAQSVVTTLEKQAQRLAKSAKDKVILVYTTNKWKYTKLFY